MNCLCANTRYAARQLTKIYEEKLKPADLTPAQFELLSMVHYRPHLSQSDLAAALGLDQTTLSRNIRLAVKHSWIKRTESSADARQAGYTLSPKGLAIWEKAFPFWQDAQQHMSEKLGENWQVIFSALEQLNRAL